MPPTRSSHIGPCAKSNSASPQDGSCRPRGRGRSESRGICPIFPAYVPVLAVRDLFGLSATTAPYRRLSLVASDQCCSEPLQAAWHKYEPSKAVLWKYHPRFSLVALGKCRIAGLSRPSRPSTSFPRLCCGLWTPKHEPLLYGNASTRCNTS